MELQDALRIVSAYLDSKMEEAPNQELATVANYIQAEIKEV